MQRVQPNHEVLSLFGIAPSAQTLNKKIIGNPLAMSLISAFFIVLFAGLVLGITTRALGPVQSSMAATTIEEEQVAFQPGQFISQEVNRGYLSAR